MVSFTADSQRKGEKIAGTGRISECRRLLSSTSDMPYIGDFIRGDWRKSQLPHLTHLAIFADRRDWRIKSRGAPPALALLYVIASSVAKRLAKKCVVLVENQRQLCLQRNKNGSPKRSKGTSNEACAVILSLCLTGIISNKTVETFCVIILNCPTLLKVTLAQKVC